jgi:hypothetical protein
MIVPDELLRECSTLSGNDKELTLRARICLRKTSKRHKRKLSSKPMMKSLEFGKQFF